MSLKANTLAYVQRPNITLVWAVTLGFATTRRFSEVGSAIASAQRGQFEARVVSVSDIEVGYGDWRGGIETRTVSIEIEDGDNSFRDLVDGRFGFTLTGSPVTVELASPDLFPGASPVDAANEWIVCFTGIFDSYDRKGPGRFVILARTDDRVLQKNPAVPILNQSDAPQAVDFVAAETSGAVGPNPVEVVPVLGGAVPFVFGAHDSRALAGNTAGTTGAIPCKYLGEYPGSIFRYAPSAGVMFHIERVFQDGVLLTPAGNWTRVTHFAPNGLVFTAIDFPSSQGTKVITCDGWGITNAMANPLAGAYDAAHPPLLRPTEIMEHILVNFGYFSWRGEASWYSRSATPLDGTSWDASKAYDDAHAYEVAFVLDEAMSKQRFSDILAEFARANGKRLWWNQLGKLCVETMDRFPSGIYFSEPRLIVADEAPDGSQVSRALLKSEGIDIESRSSWRIAAGSSVRSKATVYRPGISTWNAKSTESFDTIWSCGRRFMDRTMLTPASEKMALAAFNIGTTGSGLGVSDGGLVGTWDDAANSLRTAYPVTQAVAGQQPGLKIGRLNGRPYVSFDGLNDNMTGTALSNLMSSSEFTMFVVFRVAAATQNNGNASVYLNHVIVGDSAGVFGVYVRTSGGVYYLQCDVYDGAHRVTEVAISLDTWYVLKVSHFGGSLSFTLTDQFVLSGSVAAGNMTSLAGVISLGGNAVGGAAFSGDIAEVIVFSAGDIGVQGVTAGFVGGGAGFEIGHQLREDYGIAG